MNPQQNIFAQRAGMMPAAPPPGMPLPGVQPGVLPARNPMMAAPGGPGMAAPGTMAPGMTMPMSGVRPGPVMQQPIVQQPTLQQPMAAAPAQPMQPQNFMRQRAMAY